VSLIFLIQSGFSAVAANSTIAPQFSGAASVAIRLGKKESSPWYHWYAVPYAKAANASTSATSGTLATAVFQPGVQLMYGFGK
jgi:hypothetical protein